MPEISPGIVKLAINKPRACDSIARPNGSKPYEMIPSVFRQLWMYRLRKSSELSQAKYKRDEMRLCDVKFIQTLSDYGEGKATRG